MKMLPMKYRWFTCAFFACVLAIVAAILTDAFLAHWIPNPDFSHWGEAPLTERSQHILDTTQGHVQATAIFSKDSPISIPAGRLLRTFAQVAKKGGSMEMQLSYIDPRIDLAGAARLKTLGAKGEGVFLQHAGQSTFIPSEHLCNGEGLFHLAEAEESIAAGIHRLTRGSIKVGWLTGHNEPSYTNADLLSGLSGFARLLQNQGYVIEPVTIDTLNAEAPIPHDIRILFVVAPQLPLTTDESAILFDWVNDGGRLFCALPAKDDGGIAPLAERWGIEIGHQPIQPVQIDMNGAGLTRSLSKTHPITHEFDDSVIMTFVAPRALVYSQIQQMTIESIVQMPDRRQEKDARLQTIMAAIERDATMGDDLTLRTGRILLCGDAHFLENRYLTHYATANRELVVNAISWLGGISTEGQQNVLNILRVAQDSRSWRLDFLMLVGVYPPVFIVLVWLIFRRRK